MRKIIAIGESVLDILFDSNNQPSRSFMGGRIANAAARLAKDGAAVTMVSECCTDHAGDIVVNYLNECGVNTSSIDRYTDGATAVSLLFNRDSKQALCSNYRNYPTDRFDVVWPRIDENDVVLFGSYYSIDEALRERLFEMVTYAAERKATIIYLPGCQHGINCRITKVMPAILENLEISKIVVANRADIEAIYPGEDPDKAFHNHFEYYNPQFLFIDDDHSIIHYARGSKTTIPAVGTAVTDNLMWQADFVAAVIKELMAAGITTDAIESLPATIMDDIVAKAMKQI